MPPLPLRVGFIGFDGVNGVDLAGPLEAFATANDLGCEAGQPRCYDTIVLGVTAAPFTTDSGLTITPSAILDEAPALDTLVIPGGAGLRQPRTQSAVAQWLRERAKQIRRVASVCTGIYGLAASGLLDGRRVTTHWRFARAVAERFPALRVEPDAIFIRDGRYFTAAGVTAGIDLALALIEEDFGGRLALEVARDMVVYVKRDGGQEQYSQPLQYQVAASSDRLADLGAWIPAHLRHDLSVEALSQQACLSPRQLGRRFRQVFGTTPAEFVEIARLDAAREQLSSASRSIAEVADSVGFVSADAFRRAFLRRFGISPSTYRDRFGVGESRGQARVAVQTQG